MRPLRVAEVERVLLRMSDLGVFESTSTAVLMCSATPSSATAAGDSGSRVLFQVSTRF